MATTRRVRLQTDERRTQLIELGMRVFSDRPYDEIAMDEVAEMARVSKGLLYHYFSSKREFFVETVRAASLHLRSLTEPDLTLPPGARLRGAIDAHLDYVREHGSIYASIYKSGTRIAPEVQAILDEHRDIVMQWLSFNLGVTKPTPLLRSALRTWILTVEGMSLDWIDHPNLPQADLRELLVATYGALLKRAESLAARATAAAPTASAATTGSAATTASSSSASSKPSKTNAPRQEPAKRTTRAPLASNSTSPSRRKAKAKPTERPHTSARPRARRKTR